MEDLTGRKRLFGNIIFSWAAHILILVAGFIVPRQISDNLGVESLGIWDFGWMTVRYLSLTSMGVGASLTRYVSLHNAQGDLKSLNQSITSAFFWQVLVVGAVLSMSIFMAYYLKYWTALDSSRLDEARIVLVLLGSSLAIKMMTSVSGGIITGCHRWDIHHSIVAIQDFSLALLMVYLLFNFDGVTLIHLALAVVATSCCAAFARIYFSKKLIPDAEISFQSWHSKNAKKILRYSGKSLVSAIPGIIVFQIPAFILAALAGPVTFAIFNRGVGLIRQIQTLVKKVASMIVPITSGMQGLDMHGSIKIQILEVSRIGMAFIAPLCALMGVFGDYILILWMGPEFGHDSMMLILALGSIVPLSFNGVISICAGVNSHGKLAIANLLVTLISLAVVGLIIHYFYSWTLTSTAILTVLPWSLGRVFTTPYYIWLKFGVNPLRYISNAFLIPLACNVPFVAGLFFVRNILDQNGSLSFGLLVFVFSSLLTTLLIWVVVLPETFKRYMTRLVSK